MTVILAVQQPIRPLAKDLAEIVQHGAEIA